MSQAKTEEKKKDKKLILIILLLLFIIIGLIFFIFFMKKNDGGDDKAIDRNVLVDEDEDRVEKLINEEHVPFGSYEVTMNTTWNFEDGSSASEDAFVANVDRNTNDVYFDLIRSDTEEVILASPIIPLGMKMDKITLDKDLPKGTYDCVCTYHLVDDEKKPISRVSVEVTVNIKK